MKHIMVLLLLKLVLYTTHMYVPHRRKNTVLSFPVGLPALDIRVLRSDFKLSYTRLLAFSSSCMTSSLYLAKKTHLPTSGLCSFGDVPKVPFFTQSAFPHSKPTLRPST